MSLAVVCTTCGKSYRLNESYSGQRVVCKACGEYFIVPGAPFPQPPAKPAAPESGSRPRASTSTDEGEAPANERKASSVPVRSESSKSPRPQPAAGDSAARRWQDSPPRRDPSRQSAAAGRRSSGPRPGSFAEKYADELAPADPFADTGAGAIGQVGRMFAVRRIRASALDLRLRTIGFCLVVLGLCAMLVPIVGIVWRQIRVLDQYAPLGGLVVGLAGVWLIIYSWRNNIVPGLGVGAGAAVALTIAMVVSTIMVGPRRNEQRAAGTAQEALPAADESVLAEFVQLLEEETRLIASVTDERSAVAAGSRLGEIQLRQVEIHPRIVAFERANSTSARATQQKYKPQVDKINAQLKAVLDNAINNSPAGRALLGKLASGAAAAGQ